MKSPLDLVAGDSRMVGADRPRDDLAERRDTGDVYHEEHVRPDRELKFHDALSGVIAS
jgi:hypothetical protein